MSDYKRIERAIRYLDSHYLDQPDLRTLARAAGLSEFHFHRLFSRWAGVTPKTFLQYCTAAHAKALLKQSQNVLYAALDSGLSGPGRLHDLFVSLEGVTPGQYKAGGQGIDIRYGWHPTPFGTCLIGLTSRGVCYLSFLKDHNNSSKMSSLGELRRVWRNARLHLDAGKTGKMAEKLFPARHRPARGRKIPVLAMGTPFQIKVWEAILAIPPGRVLSYQDIARLAGQPRAARAVGSALAHNHVGYVIPCHRVIRETGVIGHFRWGLPRKQAMLAWESAQARS